MRDHTHLFDWLREGAAANQESRGGEQVQNGDELSALSIRMQRHRGRERRVASARMDARWVQRNRTLPLGGPQTPFPRRPESRGHD